MENQTMLTGMEQKLSSHHYFRTGAPEHTKDADN
jgi:hypothetical protein